MLSAILRDAAVKAIDADLEIHVTPMGFMIEGRRVAGGKSLAYRHILSFEEGTEGNRIWSEAIPLVAEALNRATAEAGS